MLMVEIRAGQMGSLKDRNTTQPLNGLATVTVRGNTWTRD